MSRAPVHLIDQHDLPDAERALLEAGRAVAPVEYDVGAGVARHRAILAALAVAGAAGRPAATGGSGVVLGAKGVFAKVVLKVLLGVILASALGGAGFAVGVWLGRRQARTAPPLAVSSVPAPVVAPTRAPAPSPAPTYDAIPAGSSSATGGSASSARAAEPLGKSALARHARSTQDVALGSPSHRTGTLDIDPSPSNRSNLNVGGSTVPAPSGRSPAMPSSDPEPQAPRAITPPPATPRPSAEAAPPPATEAASPPPNDSLAELRGVAVARSLVDRDPDAALAVLERLRAEHPRGYFTEERQALTVLALAGAGRNAAAREQAAAFLGAYPNGPYSDRVRVVLRGSK